MDNKPVQWSGNLAMAINSNQSGFMPKQFEANNLLLAYANNQIQATGNAQNLQLKINAPALYEIYAGLRGRAYGYFNVQAQPRLQASANIAIDDFAFNNLFSVKKIRVQGELPTSATSPSLLTATMDNLRSNNREIVKGQISLAGTRNAHLLKVSAENKLSKFYVQLAGGFNAQNNWLGQIQKGDFDSYGTRLGAASKRYRLFTTRHSLTYLLAHIVG